MKVRYLLLLASMMMRAADDGKQPWVEHRLTPAEANKMAQDFFNQYFVGCDHDALYKHVPPAEGKKHSTLVISICSLNTFVSDGIVDQEMQATMNRLVAMRNNNRDQQAQLLASIQPPAQKPEQEK